MNDPKPVPDLLRIMAGSKGGTTEPSGAERRAMLAAADAFERLYPQCPPAIVLVSSGELADPVACGINDLTFDVDRMQEALGGFRDSLDEIRAQVERSKVKIAGVVIADEVKEGDIVYATYRRPRENAELLGRPDRDLDEVVSAWVQVEQVKHHTDTTVTFMAKVADEDDAPVRWVEYPREAPMVKRLTVDLHLT